MFYSSSSVPARAGLVGVATLIVWHVLGHAAVWWAAVVVLMGVIAFKSRC